MIYAIYSIRDVKTGFASPFIDSCDSSAIRGFHFAFNNPSSLVNFSPADFCLYCIGTFDSDSGVIEKRLPEFICSATDFIERKLDSEK